MTRVAVIGSGVSGLTAAWVIAKSAEVTLYEADERLGGHADTHVVDGRGRSVPVDTGFIVHNERTYPVLLRLFDELDIETRLSEMSLSVRDDETGVQWAGALGLSGVFPTLRMALNPRHLAMLVELPRFHRRAKRLLRKGHGRSAASAQTLGEFLDAGRFSAHFRRHFMEPLIAAVWSCDPAVALQYPAAYLFSFLNHHGMLRVFGSPQWRTVVGGSRTYVEQVAAGLNDVRVGTKVTSVDEDATGVSVTDGSGTVTRFDAVVIATHPSQALDLLGAPTDAQREVLSRLTYSPNDALLHTDASVMPTATRARASWNFLRRTDGASGLTVTYDLSRLQGLDTTAPLLLTLGGSDAVDPALVIERMEYEHPIYTPASVAAQRRLPTLNSSRIAFAGAYHGWGFHEDGARSGVAAAEHLGFTWGSSVGVHQTTIRHTRRAPFKRAFTHESTMWVVDVDELTLDARMPGLRGGTIEARDHLGDPRASLRTNVETFLAGEGRTEPIARILLATQPRAWGHCFNPISVFWCFDAGGALASTIIEVHNTYGDRHAYVVDLDAQGRATTDKQMYVSPYHGVDGVYDIYAPVPDHRLRVAITLTTDAGEVFSASVVGEQIRERRALRRSLWASRRGSVLIRAHGIWLWVRRLPVHPRPDHHQRGVSS